LKNVKYSTWTTILIADIQEQDMLLSVKDDLSSIDFDMEDFAISYELAHLYQDVAMEIESERETPSVLPRFEKGPKPMGESIDVVASKV
jgi:hypothetical protein